MCIRRVSFLLVVAAVLGCGEEKDTDNVITAPPGAKKRVILFVWDGLRPDSVNEKDTPTLAALRKRGATFEDHHSTFPTLTMINAGSLATGHPPSKTGFYGNSVIPNALGMSANDRSPIFTESVGAIRNLTSRYGKLMLVETLFEAAHKAGLKTATLGKSGPAYLQDAVAQKGIILDESIAAPLPFALRLQTAGYRLPAGTAGEYPNPMAPDAGRPPGQIMINFTCPAGYQYGVVMLPRPPAMDAGVRTDGGAIDAGATTDAAVDAAADAAVDAPAMDAPVAMDAGQADGGVIGGLQDIGNGQAVTCVPLPPADAGRPERAPTPPPVSLIPDQPGTPLLADGHTVDPEADRLQRPNNHANLQYLMDVFTGHILPNEQPDLSVLWFRNPDSVEHTYGPGSAPARRALRGMDDLLKQLLDALKEQGLESTTNLLITTDHGHSTVSGPLDLFPLRKMEGELTDVGRGNTRRVGAIDPNGYSVSGHVRLADLLTRAGLRAYDFGGCDYEPVMMGIDAQGNKVYPDRDWEPACGTNAPDHITTGAFVPSDFSRPKTVLVAASGGTDYVYVPDNDPATRKSTVLETVRALQAREEVGAVFVKDEYGAVPGALPLSAVQLEDSANPDGTKRSPDIAVSYNYDERAVVQGMPGIIFSGSGSRGMHGSMSPIDVRATLIAVGPDFRAAFKNALPTGNLDIAPTVAKLLNVPMAGMTGRPLLEALRTGGRSTSDYQRTVDAPTTPPEPATGLSIVRPNNQPSGATSYTIELHTKTLKVKEDGVEKTYRYFDHAKAVRK